MAWTKARESIGIAAAAIACGAVYMTWRSGAVDWWYLLSVTVVVTIVYNVHPILATRKTQRARQALRETFYDQAYAELIGAMAQLSEADFSVFAVAAANPYMLDVEFGTAVGSPNHHVLVQMTDLGFTTPREMAHVGTPPNRFGFARYALTRRGRRGLGPLVRAVWRERPVPA